MGENQIFSRLRRAYLLALSLIALALIAELLLVDGFLLDQRTDAEIINVAGRQRMLSQRIAKQVALGEPAVEGELRVWQERQSWLEGAVQDEVALQELRTLDRAIAEVVSVAESDLPDRVARVNELSNAFLVRMDGIVDRLSGLATAKVARLQAVNKWLTVATLGILLLELLFIFRPIGAFIQRQFVTIDREKAAQEAARREAELAVREKDATLRHLYALNAAVDQAALFASLREDGTVVHLSKKFRQLLGVQDAVNNVPFAELLNREDGRRARLTELLQTSGVTAWKGEWTVNDIQGNPRYLELSILPARQSGREIDRFVLATDVTESKLTRRQLDELSRQQIAEEKERARQRALQTTEAQEKERLRVARDLHDGVGQNLTALKFSLESLKLDGSERSRADLERLKHLSGDIIRGVRMATFNLRPPELSDHGLASTLEKMARELSRMTGERVVFQNDHFDLELDPVIALNLYRVTQEAVNNAVKYAGANYILITLSAGPSLVSITVDDDGKGFNPEEVREKTDGSGLGMASMEDRIAQMKGRLFLHTAPESGTRITINVPV